MILSKHLKTVYNLAILHCGIAKVEQMLEWVKDKPIKFSQAELDELELYWKRYAGQLVETKYTNCLLHKQYERPVRRIRRVV